MSLLYMKNEYNFVSVGPNPVPSLQWRHNGHKDVSHHQPHPCLLNRLFGCRSKKTSMLRVAGLCVGTSPGTGEFPAQKASNAENVSIWWHHHGIYIYICKCMMDMWVVKTCHSITVLMTQDICKTSSITKFTTSPSHLNIQKRYSLWFQIEIFF